VPGAFEGAVLAPRDRTSQVGVHAAVAVGHRAQGFRRQEQAQAGVDAGRGEHDHRHVGQVAATPELVGDLGHVAPLADPRLPPPWPLAQTQR
jgi:hypothetical protein